MRAALAWMLLLVPAAWLGCGTPPATNDPTAVRESLMPAGCTARPCVLLVDDDRGEQIGPSNLPVDGQWGAALAASGVTHTTVSDLSSTQFCVGTTGDTGGDPGSLAGWDAVIWETGTQAYGNLSTTNVSTMTSYLSNAAGARLLYGGSHVTFSEINAAGAGGLFETYFGLASGGYGGNTFMPCADSTNGGCTGSLAPLTGKGTAGDPVCPTDLSFGDEGVDPVATDPALRSSSKVACTSGVCQCSSTQNGGNWSVMFSTFTVTAPAVGCYLESGIAGISQSNGNFVARNQGATFRTMMFGFDYGANGHLSTSNGNALMTRSIQWLFQPSSASAGGPYTVGLGTPIMLGATGADLTSLPLTYTWDLTAAGAGTASGQTPTVTFNQKGTFTISVKVANSYSSLSASTTVKVTGFGNGTVCTSGAQCASGFCGKAFDGSATSYCTAAQCTGCTGGNASGACVNATAGTNPNGACAAGACTSGVCDGAGACGVKLVNTDCGSGCAASTLTQKLCNAGGSCVTTTSSCGNYACAGAAGPCRTTCASGADCAGGDVCIAPNCVAGIALGGVCSADSQCLSGHCSQAFDGSATMYCTTSACIGCTGGNASGACVNAASGANPNGTCVASACATGSCNGAGACGFFALGVDCGTTCSAGTLTSRTCDGAGICNATGGSCGAYVCASGSTCKSSCAVDGDCAAGNYCVAPACVTQLGPGAVCTRAAMCASGACSPAFDGSAKSYCTSAACTGCQGGNASGACVNATAGANPNGACTAGACVTGSCDGLGACGVKPSGTDCGTACAGSTLTTRRCDGAGACSSVTASCGNYHCASSAACGTSCTSNASCVQGASCVYGVCNASGASPRITSTPALGAIAYEPYHYAPPGDLVTSSGTQPIRFGVSGPSGISIDPVTGQLYFIPTAPGSTDVTVSATNPFGSDSQKFTLVVTSPQPPAIARDANGSAAVGVPYALNAAGALTVSGAQPIAFVKLAGPPELNVGSSTGRIDWTPLASGNATVSVQAKNAYGADTYQFTVAVAAPMSRNPPTAVAIANPASGGAPLTVALDSSASTAAAGAQLVARSWTFGDGTPPSTAVAPQHVYSHGAYVARLVVQDSFGLSSTATVGITASQNGAVPPLVRIQADPTTGNSPLTVSFSCDCAQAPGASLRWTFGDGDQSTSQAPMHVYAAPGGYQVTLQALDESSGELGMDSLFITVTDGGKQPPTVRAFADPVAGDAPLTVKFASQLGDADGRVVGFEWSLGEGDSSTDPSPQKTFAQPGLYHVELRAVDNDGLQSSASLDIQVTRGGVLPPSILSKPTLTATAGVAYRYGDDGRPHARGGRPLTFGLGKMLNGQLGNAPAGMTVDPATGELTWTPTAAQTGAQPVTLTVENAAGADFQDFVVQVDGPARGSSGCSCDVGGGGGGAGWLWIFGLVGLVRWGRRRCDS